MFEPLVTALGHQMLHRISQLTGDGEAVGLDTYQSEMSSKSMLPINSVCFTGYGQFMY